MNKVKYFRELKGLTQNELAAGASLSLRTIQRIESGIEPKGHTLKMLSAFFEIDSLELSGNTNEKNNESSYLRKLRILNTSILTFLIIPYGNIIFPSIIYLYNKEEKFRKTASDLISLQILWTIITSILLIVSPFVQDKFRIEFHLILWVGIVCFIFNIMINFLNAMSLSRNSKLKISSPVGFL